MGATSASQPCDLTHPRPNLLINYYKLPKNSYRIAISQGDRAQPSLLLSDLIPYTQLIAKALLMFIMHAGIKNSDTSQICLHAAAEAG